jgi:hypothetical protein
MIRHLVRFLFRLLLALAGLVFLASLLAVALVLLLLWGLRALWSRLTGRPVQPLVFTVLRRTQWERFYRSGAAPSPEANVIDVEARPVSPSPSERLER